MIWTSRISVTFRDGMFEFVLIDGRPKGEIVLKETLDHVLAIPAARMLDYLTLEVVIWRGRVSLLTSNSQKDPVL